MIRVLVVRARGAAGTDLLLMFSPTASYTPRTPKLIFYIHTIF